MNDLRNYFNYFTEIEEHFQRARGTHLFLLSPLDWALIESWKNSAIPLEAVLRGIDAAFEKWRARRSKVQSINSLAFCSQAVLTEAQRTQSPREENPADAFDPGEITAYLSANRVKLQSVPGFEEISEALGALIADTYTDLQLLDQQLTVLESKMLSLARSRESDSEALETRRELEAQLQPYRSKMSAPQLAMLATQYLDRGILERAGLPRLSLFYLR